MFVEKGRDVGGSSSPVVTSSKTLRSVLANFNDTIFPSSLIVMYTKTKNIGRHDHVLSSQSESVFLPLP